MPLNKALEELLAQVNDEADRNAMRTNFEKYAFFQPRFEGNLRQEDYDRNLNKLKTERESEAALVKQYQEERDKWREWADKNVPKHQEMLKNYEKLELEKKALEEEKAALVLERVANPEGGRAVDPKELLAQVNETISKRGFVDKSELPALVAAEANKLVAAERDSFFKTTVPSLYNEFATMNNLQFKHRDEFNEMLDPVKFAQFRAEKNISDPNEAYDRFTFEKREAKKFAEIRKEEREKVEKEFASKMNLPGSGAPPATEFGPLQERAMGKNSGLNLEKPGYLEAAEAMRAEGKF
jgi:hypothetical protein